MLKPIVPGISLLSDAGYPLSFRPDQLDEATKQKIWARDDHTCQVCGFQARKYQEVQYIGKGELAKGKALNIEDYATACTFCHQVFQIDKIYMQQSGTLIWLPEMSQADLNNMARAIFVARISQGPIADMARAALDTLLRRKEEAKKRLGTDSPKVLASILQDFLEPAEYARRGQKLKGFAILPLDRRVVREGNLEFNQFPQILSYWRSKEGPFGDYVPKEWAKLFYDTKGQLAA
jgi:intracellular multiplication protein IcmJ